MYFNAMMWNRADLPVMKLLRANLSCSEYSMVGMFCCINRSLRPLLFARARAGHLIGNHAIATNYNYLF